MGKSGGNLPFGWASDMPVAGTMYPGAPSRSLMPNVVAIEAVARP